MRVEVLGLREEFNFFLAGGKCVHNRSVYGQCSFVSSPYANYATSLLRLGVYIERSHCLYDR